MRWGPIPHTPPPQGWKFDEDPQDASPKGRKFGEDPLDPPPTEGRKLGADPEDPSFEGWKLEEEPLDPPTGRNLMRIPVSNIHFRFGKFVFVHGDSFPVL